MKSLIFCVLLALTIHLRAEEISRKKRGIYGENHLTLGHNNLALGGLVDLGEHIELAHRNNELNHGYSYGYGGGHNNIIHHQGSGLHHGTTYGAAYGYHHRTIDLGSYVHKHITVTKKIGIPIPHPYPVHIEKKVAVPVPHPVPVPIDKPYPVHIPKPYPVPVENPVPYTVVNNVPYPVAVPVKVPVPIPIPVAKPIPIPIHKSASIAVSEPLNEQEPNFVTRPIVSLGSGSLGFVKLANGKYALGSGSLGYSSAVSKVIFTGNRINEQSNEAVRRAELEKNTALSIGYTPLFSPGQGGALSFGHQNTW